MKQKINKILFTLIPALFMAVFLILKNPVFTANDDNYIMKVLSGYIIGEPYFETAFFSVLLGYPLSWLYRLVYFPWYIIFLLTMTLLSQMIVFAKIYGCMAENKAKKWVALVYAACALALLLYHNLIVTYTTVASMTGMGAIIKLFDYIKHNNKKQFIASVLLLIISFAIRTASGIVVLGFWGIGYLYLLFVQKERFKKLFVMGLIALMVLFVSYGIDWYAKHYTAEPKGYYAFMQAQADFVDYKKMDLNTPQMQATMKDAGWDSDLYNLATGYFTMDSRLKTEGYQAFNRFTLNQSNDLSKSIKNLNEVTYQAEIYTFNFSVLGLMIFSLLAFIMLHTKRKFLSAEAGLFFAGILLLFVFQFILGRSSRVVLRASNAINLPFFALLLGIFSRLKTEITSRTSSTFVKSLIVLLLLGSVFILLQKRYLLSAIVVCIAVIYMQRWNFKKIFLYSLSVLAVGIILSRTALVLKDELFTDGQYAVLRSREQQIADLHEYAEENPDTTLIADLTLSMDFRVHVPKKKLNNLLFWGGTNVKSHVFEQQLSQRNIDVFDISILCHKNIYLLLTTDKTEILTRLLKNKGITGYFTLIEDKKAFRIYQFVQNSE